MCDWVRRCCPWPRSLYHVWRCFFFILIAQLIYFGNFFFEKLTCDNCRWVHVPRWCGKSFRWRRRLCHVCFSLLIGCIIRRLLSYVNTIYIISQCHYVHCAGLVACLRVTTKQLAQWLSAVAKSSRSFMGARILTTQNKMCSKRRVYVWANAEGLIRRSDRMSSSVAMEKYAGKVAEYRASEGPDLTSVRRPDWPWCSQSATWYLVL